MNKVTAHRKGDSTAVSNESTSEIDVTSFDPSDLLAASLAKCTSDTVTRLTEREAMSVDTLDVRVDLVKNGEAKKAEFTVHVDVNGDLSDKQLKAIDKAAAKSYIRRFLELDMEVDSHLHYNGVVL